MKTEKRPQKNSAAKRLIPAAAMLLASATMLSTATYAWFTMNKQVELKGLNMTATAGEGIEISLAAIDNSGNITFSGGTYDGNHPYDTENEKGWKSSVIVGNYYSDIGKIKPASSVNGTALYDATNAADGGRVATEFKLIPDGSGAALATRNTFSSSVTEINSTGNTGYYVDIPVHIRTSKVKPSDVDLTGDLYCKMILKNADGEAAANSLYKAVRVAFIPVTTGTGSTTNIFGVDDVYYGAGAVDSASTKAATTVVKDFVTDGADFSTGIGADSGLNLPYAAAAGKYGHLDFTLRVWLEGESTSCYDEKAGQSWKIDLAFSLGQFDVPTSP
ncbi:MAG: hypothetical protein ACI4J1_09110 [Ruminiclostridium sp.]